MEEDPLVKLTMQQINEAFETIAPMAEQTWNEALDDDEIWERTGESANTVDMSLVRPSRVVVASCERTAMVVEKNVEKDE